MLHTIKFKLGDIGLQENIYLRSWLFDALFNRYRHSFQKLSQLEFFLESNSHYLVLQISNQAHASWRT